MFNNLIESTSHAQEFKRRGSFLLFTTVTYVVLFAITGVISIYAYDAHLERQNTEIELVTFVPPPPEEVAPAAIPNTIPAVPDSGHQPNRSTRTEMIDSASNPNNPPREIGTVAPNVPPARPDSVLGSFNADPPGPPQGSRGVPGGTGNIPVDLPDIPPPPPTPKPSPVVPRVIKISQVLNSRAISLPRPNYPMIAKRTGIQGTVTVQVLIDETGKVVQAKGTGHPLLVAEAQRAAMQARFSPTIITDTPVKVSGVITYNFIMQ